MNSFAQFFVFLGTIISTILSASASGQEGSEELWCEYAGGDGPGKGKRIVMIAGDDEYRSEEAMPMLGKILAVNHGFDVTVLFPVNPESKLIQPDYQTNIPGMHRIEGADLVVLGLRFRHLPDPDMKYFVEYLNSGKPVVGFRTSTHAFRYPKESTSRYKHFSWDSTQWPGGFGRQVLGDTWISHHGRHKQQSTRGIIEPGKENHPILRGVKDIWGDTDVYGIKNLKDSADILVSGQVLQGMQPTDPPVTGAKNNPMMPLVWTQEYESKSGRKARIVCTTMGAATDFINEGLRRLLVNSCYWATGIEDQIPQESNVEIVGNYEPTKYGFDNAKTNLKPSDFDLDH